VSFYSQIKKILAVCVASDGNVENKAFLYRADQAIILEG
jgi:hypothetical protein